MSTPAKPGYPAVVDPDAESASPDLPAFIAIPKGAPVYHGFPLLPESEIEGWTFGVITSPLGDEPRVWGDAYVVAPDGSRAGIVWSASGQAEPRVLCPADEGRWGVYGFTFRHPVRSERDLIRNLHECLPQLKEFYQAALERRQGQGLGVLSNPSIERTSSGKLRLPAAAAHLER